MDFHVAPQEPLQPSRCSGTYPAPTAAARGAVAAGDTGAIGVGLGTRLGLQPPQFDVNKTDRKSVV